MKKAILTLTLLMGLTTATMAQGYDWRDNRNSLSVTVGSPSFLTGTQGFFTLLFKGGEDDNTKAHIYGTYGIHYGFNATKWLRLGASAFYSGWHIDEIKEAVTQRERSDEIVVLAKLDFTYLNREHVRLYSGIGLGADLNTLRKYKDGTLVEEEGNGVLQPGFGWAVTPIGLEVGGKHLYGLVELNLGHADLLRAGLGVKL